MEAMTTETLKQSLRGGLIQKAILGMLMPANSITA